MSSVPLLSLVTFLPLLGALLVLIFPLRNARWISLWTTLVTFGCSLVLIRWFDPASAEVPDRNMRERQL